jgi:hypothetical protein
MPLPKKKENSTRKKADLLLSYNLLRFFHIYLIFLWSRIYNIVLLVTFRSSYNKSPSYM